MTLILHGFCVFPLSWYRLLKWFPKTFTVWCQAGCDTIKNKYLGFVPGSWHTAPKTLGISGYKCIFRWLVPGRSWIVSGWGLVIRPWLVDWNFSHTHTLKGKGARDQVWSKAGDLINHNLHDEASMKTSNIEVWRVSGMVVTLECWESVAPGEGMEAPHLPAPPPSLLYACLPFGCFWVYPL